MKKKSAAREDARAERETLVERLLPDYIDVVLLPDRTQGGKAVAQAFHRVDARSNDLGAGGCAIERVIVGQQPAQVHMHAPEARCHVGARQIDDLVLVAGRDVGTGSHGADHGFLDDHGHAFLHRRARTVDHVGIGEYRDVRAAGKARLEMMSAVSAQQVWRIFLGMIQACSCPWNRVSGASVWFRRYDDSVRLVFAVSKLMLKETDTDSLFFTQCGARKGM